MSEAVPYDLTRPPPLKPGERAALRRAVARVAEMLAALATEYLGRAVGVIPTDVGCEDEDHAAAPPADHDKWLWVVAPDCAQTPVWRVETRLGSALVDIMLGCPPQVPRADERRVSRVDGRLLVLLCEEFAVAVEAAWPGAASSGGAMRCIRGGRSLDAPDPREWIRTIFELRVDGSRGRLELFIPSAAVRAAPAAPATSPVPERLHVPGVRAAPVTATVRLGTWRTTLRELAQLQPGSMIPLGGSPQASLELSVAGMARLPVRPGTSNGRVSVQVTGGPIPPD